MKKVRLKLTDTTPNVKYGTIKGGSNKYKDKSIDVNSLYFSFDGKIGLPVMGEFHFSRLNCKYWEESILKMKACGVNIIATYIFWIHHEEIEGQYDWTGSRNIRIFLELCKKHGMKVLLRLGPWAHGEARNGGFPDWIVKALPKPQLRSNNEYYLEKVNIYWNEVYKQAEGYLFKDGGTVIAVQIENEYKGSREHLMKLKGMAIEIGFDVPFYTATAWSSRGYSDIPDGEMIPAFGGYPDAPWASHIEKLHRKEQYVFTEVKNDEIIGNDLDEENAIVRKIDTSLYPYITCELGSGVQPTKHRRPIISGEDMVSMSYVKIGSGLNLVGYYMFHGGTNPYGKLTNLNETKETGYPNDLPIMTYDFQAPIGEYGIIKDSYKGYKLFHTMLSEFGDKIANTKTIIPKEESDLRYALRVNNESGFVFINNYQRYTTLDKIEDVTFELDINGRDFSFPHKPMDIPQDEYFVMPFNLDLSGINLVYSTAQPICKVNRDGVDTYFFSLPSGVRGEYGFNNNVEIESYAGNKIDLQDKVVITDIKGEINSGISVKYQDKKVQIITLNKEDALNLWKIDVKGKEEILISNNTLISYGEIMKVIVSDENSDIKVFNSDILNNSSELSLNKDENGFRSFTIKAKPSEEKEVKVAALENEGQYLISVPEDILEGVYDVNLTIKYSGDGAELYSEEKLIADNFYSNGTWKISMKHLKEVVEGKALRLKIRPLKEGDFVYLETWPKLKDGYISELINVNLEIEGVILI